MMHIEDELQVLQVEWQLLQIPEELNVGLGQLVVQLFE